MWRLPALRDLVLVNVLAFTGFFVTLSSLPVWAVDGGASLASAGIVTTALLVATVACQLLVPAAQRAIGARRLLAFGLVALGLPTPLYVASQDLVWLSAVSAARGVGFAIVTVVGATLLAELAPPGRRGEAIGVYGVAIAIPNLAAVPVGASLALSGHFEIVAIVGAAPVLAAPFVRRLPGVGRARAPAASWGGAIRAVLPACAVLGVVTVAGGGLVTFLPVERSDGAVAGLALFAFGLCGALGRWRVGRIADRRGTTRVLLPVALVVAAGGVALVAAGLTSDGAVVVLGGAVAGAGYGAVQNLTLLAALGRAGPERTTTATAAWNASFDTGTALGAWAVGAVAAAGPGLAATYLGCAALLLLALPLGVVAGGR
jgi:predicted MFS family arabinose efflux permease